MRTSAQSLISIPQIDKIEEPPRDIEKEIKEYLKDAGVGKRFLEAKIGDFSEEFNNISKKHSLFVYGPRGTGKTHLLAAVARELFLNKLSFEFMTAPDLLLGLRRDMDESVKKTMEYAGTPIIYYEAPLRILFIDDLGTEKVTDWALSTIYTIIDGRYRNCLRTFISSNYSLDELADRTDDRISSRLAEMCYVVKLVGNDLRLKS